MRKPHYAWAVCLGCTLMLLVSGGLSVNAFSVTQPYILKQGGFTNTQTSMITTVRAVTYLLCMFLSPRFFRRTGYRLGTAIATALSGAAFLIFAFARTLPVYYATGAVAGLSYGLGSMIPATILMNHWFHRQRGLAIGLCSAGTGLGMVLLSPVLTLLCERFGLKVCFLAEAVFSLLCAALVFLLVRESPERCGLRPCGEGELEEKRRARPVQPVPELRPLRWMMLCLAAVLLGAIASPGPSHLMILYTTAGIPETSAAMAVSLFGLALMLGKCVYGAACDRFGGWRTDWLFGAALCAGLALCTLAGSRSIPLMLLAAALYGFGVALSTVGLAIWAGDFGGEARADTLVQRFQLCYGIGGLALSTMPGMFADWTGSYAPAYLVLLACAVYSLLAVQSTYCLKQRVGP